MRANVPYIHTLLPFVHNLADPYPPTFHTWLIHTLLPSYLADPYPPTFRAQPGRRRPKQTCLHEWNDGQVAQWVVKVMDMLTLLLENQSQPALTLQIPPSIAKQLALRVAEWVVKVQGGRMGGGNMYEDGCFCVCVRVSMCVFVKMYAYHSSCNHVIDRATAIVQSTNTRTHKHTILHTHTHTHTFDLSRKAHAHTYPCLQRLLRSGNC